MNGAKRPADQRQFRQQTRRLTAAIRNAKETDNAFDLFTRLPCELHRFVRPLDEGESTSENCRSASSSNAVRCAPPCISIGQGRLDVSRSSLDWITSSISCRSSAALFQENAFREAGQASDS